jgi:hypothetical protein
MYEIAVLSEAASGDVSTFFTRFFIRVFISRLAKFAFWLVLSLFSADLCLGNVCSLFFKIRIPLALARNYTLFMAYEYKTKRFFVKLKDRKTLSFIPPSPHLWREGLRRRGQISYRNCYVF